MPANTVYVGRPSRWGNPWRAGQFRYLTGPKTGKIADRADVVEMFENSLHRNDAGDVLDRIRAELAGKNLACWCRIGEPCHADVLLRIANDTHIEGENP